MRCLRLWTNEQGQSQFEDGMLAWQPGQNQSVKTDKLPAMATFFEETASTSQPTWHTAPDRQLVVTLGGTLEFTTAAGQQFTIEAGDVLFAEDTTGSGHGWRIAGDQPWRRMYVVLQKGADVPFQAKQHGVNVFSRDSRS